jgi:hypothetical protein
MLFDHRRTEFGAFPLPVEEEWDVLEGYLIDQVAERRRRKSFRQHDVQFTRDEVKHAFYMGALMMFGKCVGATADELRGFAADIDRYLDVHAESCEGCQEARKDGMPSILESLNQYLEEQRQCLN